MKIIIQDRNVCNIPILDIFEANEKEKRPIVIMLHGAKGRKEKYIERALKYVKNGYFVTLFDAYGHGELSNLYEKLDITGYDESKINKLLRFYTDTSKYINIIVDSYKDIIYADSDRIGLIGVSMGAHTIYYNIAKEKNPKIKVAVAINGSPSWINFVRRYVAAIPDGNTRFSENKIIKIEKYMKTIEPINYFNNFNNFPLLILNGKMDKLIPINDVRKSYTKLQSSYDKKELIKFIEYEEIGHTVTTEMLEEAYRWIKVHI